MQAMRTKRCYGAVKRGAIFLFFSISAAVWSQEGLGRDFSARLADAGWQHRFEEALSVRAAEDRIPAFSLKLVYRMLGNAPVQEDPARAAENVALFAKLFDEDLRKGYPPQSTMAAYRQCWRTVTAETGEGEKDGAGDGAKIRASLKAARDKIAKDNASRGSHSKKKSPGGGKNPGQGPGSGDGGTDGGNGDSGGSGNGKDNSGGGGK